MPPTNPPVIGNWTMPTPINQTNGGRPAQVNDAFFTMCERREVRDSGTRVCIPPKNSPYKRIEQRLSGTVALWDRKTGKMTEIKK
jgi:hypothetical protein